MGRLLDKIKDIVFPSRVKSAMFEVAPGYPPMPKPVAAFHSKLTKLKDGDTQEFEVNKHHGDCSKKTIRLLGVDTRETTGKEKVQGLLDKEYVAQWMAAAVEQSTKEDGFVFVVQTVAQDKYGRWLGWVWRECDGACLNIDLVTSGHFKAGPASAQAYLMRDVIESSKGI